jgi:hypothetical protein
MGIYLRLDNVEFEHKVVKHKAISLLIGLGGLQKSLASGFLFITLLVTKQLFENEILGSLFLVKKRSFKEKAEADDIDDGDDANKFTEELASIVKQRTGKITDAPKTVKPCRFVTARERKDFFKLKDNLFRAKPTVERSDITSMISHILSNRVSYNSMVTSVD